MNLIKCRRLINLQLDDFFDADARCSPCLAHHCVVTYTVGILTSLTAGNLLIIVVGNFLFCKSSLISVVVMRSNRIPSGTSDRALGFFDAVKSTVSLWWYQQLLYIDSSSMPVREQFPGTACISLDQSPETSGVNSSSIKQDMQYQ